MGPRSVLMSPNVERALRFAAVCHQGQFRKGTATPYFQHVAAVALILDRLDFEEDVVVAGLLHDTVEDTAATLDEIRMRFGDDVVGIVRLCSEIKTDNQGQPRPWRVRKREHLEALVDAPTSVRAVILADKLHNLLSIECDLRDGSPVWSIFNAGRAEVLAYYQAAIDRCGQGDERLERLAAHCREILAEIDVLDPPQPPLDGAS